MPTKEFKVAVIGFGATHLHDNEVGTAVARRLREKTPPEIPVLEQSGNALDLVNAMEGSNLVILVDSSCTGAEPGTILRLDGSERPGYADWFPHYSTHSVGLSESFQVNQMLGTMPERMLLFCVEGSDYSQGDGLSPAVESAIDRVVEMLLKELNDVPSSAIDPS